MVLDIGVSVNISKDRHFRRFLERISSRQEPRSEPLGVAAESSIASVVRSFRAGVVESASVRAGSRCGPGSSVGLRAGVRGGS